MDDLGLHLTVPLTAGDRAMAPNRSPAWHCSQFPLATRVACSATPLSVFGNCHTVMAEEVMDSMQYAACLTSLDRGDSECVALYCLNQGAIMELCDLHLQVEPRIPTDAASQSSRRYWWTSHSLAQGTCNMWQLACMSLPVIN